MQSRLSRVGDRSEGERGGGGGGGGGGGIQQGLNKFCFPSTPGPSPPPPPPQLPPPDPHPFLLFLFFFFFFCISHVFITMGVSLCLLLSAMFTKRKRPTSAGRVSAEGRRGVGRSRDGTGQDHRGFFVRPMGRRTENGAGS